MAGETDTTDRLLRRIGLYRAPAPDAAGLRAAHRAFLSRVPYEDLAVQLGEARPLDPVQLTERVLHGGRGGYCFEVNTVLAVLLEGLGFTVERREGIVGPRDAHARGEPTNHMALVVTTAEGERFVADAGWGEGPLDPLPLRAGPFTAGRLTWRLERDRDGWWAAQHRWGSSPGFRFADAAARLEDFAAHHARLSTSPDSSFVQTLVVQQPHADHVVTLRARTLAVDGPDLRARRVLPDERAFAATLRDTFGIDPRALGGERLERLWRQACEQHVAHGATRSRAGAAAGAA